MDLIKYYDALHLFDHFGYNSSTNIMVLCTSLLPDICSVLKFELKLHSKNMKQQRCEIFVATYYPKNPEVQSTGILNLFVKHYLRESALSAGK